MISGSVDLLLIPFAFTLTLIVMWSFIGPAVITPVVIMILYVPLNGALMSKFANLQVTSTKT